ncbi:MAG: hypothetical protein IT553_03465 [Sphingomonadaceae bacterium]|nr:hypothetical protein [Sphingomonadaceae bacterium]
MADPEIPASDTTVPETPADTVDPSATTVDTAPSAATSESGATGGWSSYGPVAVGAILLLSGIVWWLRRRKAAAAEEDVAVAPASSPPPAAKTKTRAENLAGTPTAPPAPRPAYGGKRAKIDVAIVPLHASTTLINFRLRYAIDIRNDGELDAADLRARIGLFAGNQTNASSIGHWFELDGQEIHHIIAALPAGETTRVEGELAAPIGAIGTFRQGNRQGAIPILAIDCRYGHAPGTSPIDAATAKAFVLGCENAEAPGEPDARLAPLPIDRGPSNFTPLGVRDTGISKRR